MTRSLRLVSIKRTIDVIQIDVAFPLLYTHTQSVELILVHQNNKNLFCFFTIFKQSYAIVVDTEVQRSFF